MRKMELKLQSLTSESQKHIQALLTEGQALNERKISETQAYVKELHGSFIDEMASFK